MTGLDIGVGGAIMSSRRFVHCLLGVKTKEELHFAHWSDNPSSQISQSSTKHSIGVTSSPPDETHVTKLSLPVTSSVP